MRQLPVTVLAISMVALSIAVACLPFILPHPADTRANADFLVQASTTFSLSAFAVTAAVLFVLGLQNLKQDFKRTYYLICAGLVTQALALLAYPVSIYLGILGRGVTSSGGDLFYLVGGFIIFLGISNFARLLEFPTVLRRSGVMLAVSAGIAALLWLLPNGPVSTSELYFHITRSFISIDGILSFFGVALVWTIRSRTSRLYARPLLWLAYAMACNGIGEALYFVANLMPDKLDSPNNNIGITSAFAFLVSRLIYIVSGYLFIRMMRQESFHQKVADPIDVIVEMGYMVSRPDDVDPLLDSLRHITARLTSHNNLTAEQLATLRELYYKLEDYLVNREALLDFTKESLRVRLENKFGTLAFLDASLDSAAGQTPNPNQLTGGAAL